MGEPTLQRRIWAAYMSRGFSRHKFARSLGVHGSTVVTWCTGERDPDLRQLIAVALLLDYPLEQIVFGRPGQAGARAVVEGRVPPSDETLRAVVRSFVVLIGSSTVYGSSMVPPRLAHIAAERWSGGDDADASTGLGKMPLDVAMAHSLLALRRGPDLDIPKHGPGRETAQRALRGWANAAAHGHLREALERGVRDDAALALRVGQRLIELATDDDADAWAACVREVVDELTGAAERRRVFAAMDAAEALAGETGAATADEADDGDEADDEREADELEHDAQQLVRWRPSPVASQRRPATPATPATPEPAAPEPAAAASQRRPAAPPTPAAPDPAAPDSSQPGGLGRAREAYNRMMDASRAGGGRSLSDAEIDALIAREVSQVSRWRAVPKAPAVPPSDKPGPTRGNTPGSRTRR
jgi:transcriptional regulator with XRE-family HTH domain